MKTIREYIHAEPKNIQPVLKKLYAHMKKVTPRGTTEKLAWGMPTLCLEGNLVHFAAFKNHFSIFPGTDAIVHFKKDLAKFQTSKGTIQLSYEKPIPSALITRIVKYCVKRNLALAAAKKKAKAKKKKKK